MEYIQSLLEGKGADLKIEALKDIFSCYNPIENTNDTEYHGVR